jgi:hypothetical protein
MVMNISNKNRRKQNRKKTRGEEGWIMYSGKRRKGTKVVENPVTVNFGRDLINYIISTKVCTLVNFLSHPTKDAGMREMEFEMMFAIF